MTTDNDSEKTFSELLDEYQEQEGISHFEGSSGLKSLNKICNALGYGGSPFGQSGLEQFLEDNPGAMCAIVEWISDSSGDNFRDELISNLNEPEETKDQKYFVYGSGMIGCLYDYGPNFCEKKEDAISSFVQLFGESLEPGELEEMKTNLHMEGYHRFRKAVIAGAHYCEVSEETGEMPENQDD